MRKAVLLFAIVAALFAVPAATASKETPVPYSQVSQCPCGGPYGLPDCTLQLNDYVAYVHNGTGVIVVEECLFYGSGWVVLRYGG